MSANGENRIRRFDDDEWHVSVSRVGTGLHVSPVKGLLGVGNWALNPYHRRGLGNFFAQVWRTFSGAYYRREYPSERMLAKAVRECEAFCEGENAAERRAAEVVRQFDGSGAS